jgi:hypothetical protein
MGNDVKKIVVAYFKVLPHLLVGTEEISSKQTRGNWLLGLEFNLELP